MSSGSMFDPSYAASYVESWLLHGARGRRFILWAAEEQHGNLKQLLWDRKHHGRVPHWCDLGDYVKSVRILRAAARSINRSGSTAGVPCRAPVSGSPGSGSPTSPDPIPGSVRQPPRPRAESFDASPMDRPGGRTRQIRGIPGRLS